MKNILFLLLIGMFSFFTVNSSYASPFAGGEISYVCVGGNNYQITFTYYRNCECCTPSDSQTVYFTCGQNSAFDFSAILAKYGTESEITNSCSANPSLCTNSSSSTYGVTKTIYQGIVTLPACSNWNIYWTGSTTRDVFATISGSGGIYVPAQLDNSVAANSSPVFNNDMIPQAYLLQETTFDCGGVDPDGDSLSYSFYAPYTSGSILTSVNYNVPYSDFYFLPCVSGIILYPTTGEISFLATQTLKTLYGVRVDQWRDINGISTLVGSTYKDFTINIIYPTTQVPKLSGIDTTSSAVYSPQNNTFFINKCDDGNPILFTINGFDVDTFNSSNIGSPELFNISWNSGISGATFTPHNNGTDHAYAEFSWLPNSNDFGEEYSFTATVQDLSCPYYLSKSYTYIVKLINSDINIGNDTTVCYGENLFIQSVSDDLFTDYTWSIDGVPTNGSTTDNFISLSPSQLSPGVHTLNLEASGGETCYNSQEIQIMVLDPLQEFSLGSDTTIANNASITLTLPSGYSSYQWSTGSTANTITIDNSINWANTITGTVFDSVGCSISDEIVILFGNVGIDSQKESVFNVYPNPIDDVINIKFDSEVKDAKLNLYDINGKLVRTAEFSSKEYTLKGLSDLPTGNYFMKITIDNKEFEYSIIKN